jgi:hypothetical protein
MEEIKMKNPLAIAILLKLILATSLFAQQQYPNLWNVVIGANVSYNANERMFYYAYILASDDTNRGGIESFEVDISRIPNTLAIDTIGLRFENDGYTEKIARRHFAGLAGRIIPIGFLKTPQGLWSGGYTNALTAIFDGEPYLLPGQSLGGFEMMSKGLPGIRRCIVSPYFDVIALFPDPDDTTLTDYGPPVDSVRQAVKFRTFTIGPTAPPSNFVSLIFLDTLSSYATRSRTLHWVANQSTADKYAGLFARAKSDLQQNNTNAARARLDTVLRQIPLDSIANLTSEAYALLKFNTEYLLSQLAATHAPSIAALTPAITFTNVGTFTLTVAGSRFTNGSVVEWNGAARTTTFISSTELRANILAGDVAAADSPRVTVRNTDGSVSNAVRFKVVSALPQVLRPVFNCIVQEPNGTLSAWFGYENLNSGVVYMPVDPSRNKFTPAPHDRGQPTLFQPGSRERVFRVELNNQLKWHLNGAQATANRNGTRCP